MKAFKRIKIILALILIINSFSLKGINANAQESISLQQAKNIIQNYYIGDVDSNALNSSSIEDIVKDLDDPYSTYFTKDEYEKFTNSIDNKFTGIGVQLIKVNDGLEIVSVMYGSPAEKAGLKTGDIITKADNNDLKGLSQDEAVSCIKGEAGTTVHLSIKRNGVLINVDVLRKEISMPTVEGTVLKNNIGYIVISSFGEDTPSQFYEVLERLEESHVDGYIVDLRYNTGGYVISALDIGGYFIGNCPIMIMKDKNESKIVYKAYYHKNVIDKPMIFLINEYTASASEILSAAVKDYKIATFIGKTTYGKGVAQSVFNLSDGSYLKITTNEFLSPLGNIINKVGISPDLYVDDNYIDSLYIAKFLFSQLGNENSIEALQDKKDYMKVIINDKSYYINLNEAIKDENWEAFRYILNNIDEKFMFLGLGNKWISPSLQDVKDETRILFPNSRILMNLKKTSSDKKINIVFNKAIDDKTANNDTIQLIDGNTGKRIAASVSVNNKKITLSADKGLQAGFYYLVIGQDIKDKQGGKLKNRTVVKVTVTK